MMRNKWRFAPATAALLTVAGLLGTAAFSSLPSVAKTMYPSWIAQKPPQQWAYKDPPWIVKDWATWNYDDYNIILTESPWGYSSLSPVTMRGERSDALLEFEVQLRSALPMRQALLRKLQLEKGYDKMKPDKKLDFDQAHPHDLDATDQVLVYVANESAEGHSAQVAPHSRPRQAALRLPDGILVQPTGTRILRIDDLYNETLYSFPRVIGGKPLISPGDSFLEVELGAILVLDRKTNQVVPQDFQESPFRYKFKIADMIYKGKLEY